MSFALTIVEGIVKPLESQTRHRSSIEVEEQTIPFALNLNLNSQISNPRSEETHFLHRENDQQVNSSILRLLNIEFDPLLCLSSQRQTLTAIISFRILEYLFRGVNSI